MALPGGIEAARSGLSAANNSYAEVQKQLDRYNKIFEVYANASPETQIRAASVMRQALNEYNGLKRQQEENALRIYEAQGWVNYYNKNNAGVAQPVVQNQLTQKVVLTEGMPEVQQAAVEEVPVIATETPGTLNDNTMATMVQADALNTDTTMNVPVTTAFSNAQAQNTVKPTTPVSVTNYINSQTPKYPNTTISPATNYNYTGANYGAGSVAGMNNTPKYTSTNRTATKYSVNRRNSSNGLLGKLIRKGAKYFYNYIIR